MAFQLQSLSKSLSIIHFQRALCGDDKTKPSRASAPLHLTSLSPLWLRAADSAPVAAFSSASLTSKRSCGKSVLSKNKSPESSLRPSLPQEQDMDLIDSAGDILRPFFSADIGSFAMTGWPDGISSGDFCSGWFQSMTSCCCQITSPNKKELSYWREQNPKKDQLPIRFRFVTAKGWFNRSSFRSELWNNHRVQRSQSPSCPGKFRYGASLNGQFNPNQNNSRSKLHVFWSRSK